MKERAVKMKLLRREPKTYIYSDMLNDDFAEYGIVRKELSADYKYQRNSILWTAGRFLVYDIIARPLVFLFTKLVYRQRFVNRDILKKTEGGYYLFANHTGGVLDAFCPNIADISRNNYIIVGPDAMSIKGLNNILYLLGAIPHGSCLRQMRELRDCVFSRVGGGDSVTVYPEGHIWPFYTGIRPFKDDSFMFPAADGRAVYAMTNCYRKGSFLSFPKVVTFIDGPFFADSKLSARENRKLLRDKCYNAMKARADIYSDYEYAEYIYRGDNAEAQIIEGEYTDEEHKPI